MAISLLPDKTLGHLMELAFNTRKEKLWLYFRSKKLHANYPIDDLLDLQIHEYKLGDFFTLKVLPGPQTFRLIENNSLRTRLEKNFSDQGFLSKKDEILLIKNKKAIQSLQDVIEVNDDQSAKLKDFLQKYAQEFSDKKLSGQEDFDKSQFFCADVEAELSNEKIILRKGTHNLGHDGAITDFYCHKVLYLDYIKKISLHKIRQREISNVGKDQSYFTKWSTGERPGFLWHIVYDIPESKPELLPIDKATRKGLEKKWDALQTIWEVYSANGANCTMIPIASFTIKGRSEQLIESIFDAFVRDGIFKSWKKVEHIYEINSFNHKLLPEYYRKIQQQYKLQADAYKETLALKSSNLRQRFNVDLNSFTITWDYTEADWNRKSDKKVPSVLHFAKFIFNAYLSSGRSGLVPNSDAYAAAFSRKTVLSKSNVKQLQNQRDQLVRKLDHMFPDSSIKPSETIVWENQSTYIEKV